MKIKKLIFDIKNIFQIEKIKVSKNNNIILDKKYKKNLSHTTWIDLNNVYDTLYSQKKLPNILKKFTNKTNDNKKKKHKFIDTFTGCGGLSLGLQAAGFNQFFINEIEEKYLETYYFNHDICLDNYHCGDIKELVENYELYKKRFVDIDLLVGGPPCQGFSMANRQRIIDDPRNKLYKYYLEFLHKVRPKAFIMENVKGILNKVTEIKDNFHDVLGDAYSIEIMSVNAKDFGIPENRARVFVIGTRLKNITAKQIVEDILERGKNQKKYVLGDALYGLPKLEPKRESNSNIENDFYGYKFKKDLIAQNDYIKYINNGKEIDYIYNHTNRYNNDRDIEIFGRLPQGANSLHESISDIMPYTNRKDIFKDKYYKLDNSKVSKTITSHMKFDCNMYIHPTQARGLSPREAARIQSFPDDYVFMGSNNNWYAQIGNAVPVKLAQIIGEEIIKYL